MIPVLPSFDQEPGRGDRAIPVSADAPDRLYIHRHIANSDFLCRDEGQE